MASRSTCAGGERWPNLAPQLAALAVLGAALLAISIARFCRRRS